MLLYFIALHFLHQSFYWLLLLECMLSKWVDLRKFVTIFNDRLNFPWLFYWLFEEDWLVCGIVGNAVLWEGACINYGGFSLKFSVWDFTGFSSVVCSFLQKSRISESMAKFWISRAFLKLDCTCIHMNFERFWQKLKSPRRLKEFLWFLLNFGSKNF
jgi:hypothetical protein